MFDLKWIRENPDAFDAALAKRGLEPQAAAILKLDEQRRTHVQELQNAQARRNAASKEIGQAKAKGDEKKAQALIDEVATLKASLQEGEEEERRLNVALLDALSGLPNRPLDDVPVGEDESANVEVRTWGNKPKLSFKPKQHFEIGEALGLMDFETAAKLSGSRFVVLKGALARLERALAAFMLDLQTGEHGYQEVQPPVLVRDEILFGTGQLPKFAEDQFKATSLDVDNIVHGFSDLLDAIDEGEVSTPMGRKAAVTSILGATLENYLKGAEGHALWLIPTAEVPLTNLVRESIIDEADLPMRVTAWTPCFRAEAGAAGKDTRGMIRQHQFSKVEMVSLTTEDQGLEELERMTGCAEEVLKRLELPYRTVVLSTGDMGFAARKTYDIEVWLPGQDTYREISSCSLCGDFQARRMNARYRAAADPKDIRFLHTLNGSGLAVGRTLIAVLENYQQSDGSVTVPPALRPYMGGLETIAAS